ncbi:hypothetical protein BH11ARM1_BH11ARM1_04930 [soil metagenome]
MSGRFALLCMALLSFAWQGREGTTPGTGWLKATGDGRGSKGKSHYFEAVPNPYSLPLSTAGTPFDIQSGIGAPFR